MKPLTWVRFMSHGEIRIGQYLGDNGLGFAVIAIDRYPFNVEVPHSNILGNL